MMGERGRENVGSWRWRGGETAKQMDGERGKACDKEGKRKTEGGETRRENKRIEDMRE